jgi:hypothetical protein
MSFSAESSVGITTDEAPLVNNGGFYTDIIINNIVFDGDFLAPGVIFTNVNSSTISNCTFGGGDIGIAIWDIGSNGGNSYTNDKFLTARTPIRVSTQNSHVVLERCQFGEPTGSQSAQATDLAALQVKIPIAYLPFRITAPGTYLMMTNLTASGTPLGGINISTAIPGPVVVDLNGFTLTGTGDSDTGISIGLISLGVANIYPITIKNGTIINFSSGVLAYGYTSFLFDLTIDKIVFLDSSVQFSLVNSSTVRHCIFTNSSIFDEASAGGNSYRNDTFINSPAPFTVFNRDLPLVLERCQFSAPASKVIKVDAAP